MQHGSSFAVSSPEVSRDITLHHRYPELTLRWTATHIESSYCK